MDPFRTALLGLGLVAVAAGGAVSAQPPAFTLIVAPRPPAHEPIRTSPPRPDRAVFPIQLVLDDGSAEADTGVSDAGGTRQFLWFNRFASPGAFTLEEAWVLFSPGPQMAVGAAVELVVYHDPDGDPSNGASFLASFSETIQALDGSTFSIYPVSVPVPAGGDVLIGVVDRFVTSGVTPTVFPAALDTMTSQGRSWLAVWTGDPPSPPALPATSGMAVVDGLPGSAGNWLIRGFGTPAAAPPAPEIPTAGGVGLALLGTFLGLAGLWILRRAAA